MWGFMTLVAGESNTVGLAERTVYAIDSVQRLGYSILLHHEHKCQCCTQRQNDPPARLPLGWIGQHHYVNERRTSEKENKQMDEIIGATNKDSCSDCSSHREDSPLGKNCDQHQTRCKDEHRPY